jgi:serine O-acetyltransferase
MEINELISALLYENKEFKSFKSIIKALFICGNKNAVFLIRVFQIFSKLKIGFVSYFIRNRLIKKYGIFITSNTVIEKGLTLPHPDGIIFGDKAVIGRDVIIFQQVTVGSRCVGGRGEVQYPVIGDECVLSSGCKILGSINVGSRTVVGSNAVLLNSTKDNSTMVGIPAKDVNNEKNI